MCIVQVWSIGQPTPNFTLEGHDKGVNAVDYFTGGKARHAASCTHIQSTQSLLPGQQASMVSPIVQLCTAAAYP